MNDTTCGNCGHANDDHGSFDRSVIRQCGICGANCGAVYGSAGLRTNPEDRCGDCGHNRELHCDGTCFANGTTSPPSCPCRAFRNHTPDDDMPPPQSALDVASLCGALAYAIESAEYFLDCRNLDMVRIYLASADHIGRAIRNANNNGMKGN